MERLARSLRLDVCELYDLTPLLGFVGDELAELGRRARQNRDPQISQSRLHFGIGEAFIDLLIEPVNDLRWCVLGGPHAINHHRLVAWHELAYGRDARQRF